MIARIEIENNNPIVDSFSVENPNFLLEIKEDDQVKQLTNGGWNDKNV
jgi:hypothetical protein